MLVVNTIDLVEYKPLRSSPRIRVLLDIGECTPDQMRILHELLMEGEQKLTMLLARTKDFEDLDKEENHSPG